MNKTCLTEGVRGQLHNRLYHQHALLIIQYRATFKQSPSLLKSRTDNSKSLKKLDVHSSFSAAWSSFVLVVLRLPSCVTCDLHPLLVGAGVTGAGHDHSDCGAVLLPHGGAGGQFATHGVQDHFVQVALQERQQHLKDTQVGLMSV